MWRALDFMQELGLEANSDTYNYLILRSCQAKNVEFALQLYAELGLKGLSPSLPSIENLVCIAAELGDARLAIDLAESFEAGSVRRLSTATWVACLDGAAESLYVSVLVTCSFHD
jgi:pentatricopeptide repeat protein